VTAKLIYHSKGPLGSATCLPQLQTTTPPHISTNTHAHITFCVSPHSHTFFTGSLLGYYTMQDPSDPTQVILSWWVVT